jgi:16S rRNA C1402 N4-methylase RsmH
LTSLKNKVKDAADKAETSIQSTGKKDDAAAGDAEDITRGEVTAGATEVSRNRRAEGEKLRRA